VPARTTQQDRRHRWLRQAALAIGIAAVVAPLARAQTAPIVPTTTGTFQAVTSPSNASVYVFFGIRYAAAPEGPLRWTPPQAPTPPTGTVVAGTPGAACPQPADTSPVPQSEDCLFLNVYVPASAMPSSKLPVFFWIHGGSFITGLGTGRDPSAIVAANDIVAVTVNYRLGALGWLVEPGLAAAAKNAYQNKGDAGDYGLMDQQFAMKWVQTNIAGFGGDPTKVTIAGQSAGGISVLVHLASTKTAAHLFRGAIVESGAQNLQAIAPSQAAYLAAFGAAFDAAVGCMPADAACLQEKSVADILAAQESVFPTSPVLPVSGTRILPKAPMPAFSAGAFIRVPVLQGTNANEGRDAEPNSIPNIPPSSATTDAGGPANYALSNANGFCATPQGGPPAVCSSYEQEINLFLAAQGLPAAINTPAFDRTLAADYDNFPDPYLSDNAFSADEGLAQILTDLVFACNGYDANLALARFVTVYAYEFNDPDAPPANPDPAPVSPPNDQFGFPTAAEHEAELQFLFGGSTLNGAEQALAADMQTYWANFVKNRNPGKGNLVPAWPKFTASTHRVQSLAPAGPEPFSTFAADHFCSIWQPIIRPKPGKP
jgi:para-nitrobenzyl esterase